MLSTLKLQPHNATQSSSAAQQQQSARLQGREDVCQKGLNAMYVSRSAESTFGYVVVQCKPAVVTSVLTSNGQFRWVMSCYQCGCCTCPWASTNAGRTEPSRSTCALCAQKGPTSPVMWTLLPPTMGSQVSSVGIALSASVQCAAQHVILLCISCESLGLPRGYEGPQGGP